ncbi:MAG: winged helix-turn-helix transcriptional regulator [Chloroflexota bacterium]
MTRQVMETATSTRTKESANPENELNLLEAIEAMPETTQADLATQVGVAVGTVNWYLKRWSKKGYVKISRIGRWKWSYLLTPQGISHKTTLAREYLEASLSLYRRTRQTATRMIGEAREAGFDTIAIQGQGEIAEICQLTCLEQQMKFVLMDSDEVASDDENERYVTVAESFFEKNEVSYPIIQIEHRSLTLVLPA